MSEFKPGDRIVSPMGGEYMYVGQVDGTCYAVPLYAGKFDPDTFAVPFVSLKRFRPAPKPFFEEKKNYQYTDGGVVSVWHVVELANGPVAVGQSTNGTPCMMTSFNGWREAK